MKDKSFFAGAADLRQKLNNTIIRYDNEPVFCQTDGTHELLFLTKLGAPKETRFNVEPDDRRLNYSSPPLGFVNTDRHCFYVGRVPTRRSVQGLSEGSLQTISLDGTIGPIGNLFHSPRLGDCIRGKYPTWAEVLKKILAARAAMSIAFDRSFALRRMDGPEAIALFHRYLPIGEYLRDRNHVQLSPTYDNPVMYRQLRELGVPVNESQY